MASVSKEHFTSFLKIAPAIEGVVLHHVKHRLVDFYRKITLPIFAEFTDAQAKPRPAYPPGTAALDRRVKSQRVNAACHRRVSASERGDGADDLPMISP